MKDFKKRGSFGGGHSAGGFQKPGFDRGGSRDSGGFRGGPKRDFSRPSEMHQATCSDCGKMCEVPFRPNGKKPVFCKECFANHREDAPERSFSRSDSASRPPFRSVGRHEDRRESRHEPRHEGGERQGSDLKNQVESLNFKLDKLIGLVETFVRSSQSSTVRASDTNHSPVKESGKENAKPATKASVKKIVKKAAKKASKK